MAYAQGTEVPASKTIGEIRTMLRKAGDTAFAFAEEDGQAGIQFRLRDRSVRLVIQIPDPTDEAFTLTPTGRYERTEKQAREAWEAEVRRRWRALALLLKAKLVAVMEAPAVSSYEEEFLPYFVTDTGETVAQRLAPHLEALTAGAAVPSLLGTRKALTP